MYSLSMKQFDGDFDQYSVAFKLAQARSKVHDDHLLINALQRGVSYHLAVTMTGAALPRGQEETRWKWEQWLDKAGEFYRNNIWLHNIRGGSEPSFILPATRPVALPEDPDAMDVDVISDKESEPRRALLCSVCHKENCPSRNKGIPRRTKGNHSLPRNQWKKKSPCPALINPELASFMMEHDISTEKVLELIKPYYYGYPGETTNDSDGDTSYESSPAGRNTTTKWGITIPLILQPTNRGNKAKTIALVDSGAMIDCIDINFTRRMKWPLEKPWQPTLARNADGSNNAGGPTRNKVQLTLQINRKSLEQDFFATKLKWEEKVILGHPWLTAYNPTIDWISGKVTLEGTHTPHLPTRPPTPWWQQSPRTHPCSWMVPPHQALGGAPWRAEIKKWRMELQPEEFTDKPYLANMDNKAPSVSTHETGSSKKNRRRRGQWSSGSRSLENLFNEYQMNADPWETRLIESSPEIKTDPPTEITPSLLLISNSSLSEDTRAPELTKNMVTVDHDLNGG